MTFSVHIVPPPPPNCATVRIHQMAKYLAINPSNDNTWCAIMATSSSLLAFFTQESFVQVQWYTLKIFLPTLCLVSSGFLANLFLISFCIQNRLRGNYCLRSPSFCMVCTSRKWRRWYEETKTEKMNRLQNKVMVLKFCSSCYLRLLAAPDKTLEHLCKSCDNRKLCLVL